MNKWTSHIPLSAVLVLGILATATVAAAGEYQADYKAIAERLVKQCAGIQEGEIVLIHGTTKDIELIEDIAIHVRKRGAFPLPSITTEDLKRRMYDEVPAKYDAQTPELSLKLAGIIDAAITITPEENPALLANVPPERIAAHSKAFEPVYKAMQSRNVRRVNLGNGLYPTAALASRFGIAQDKLAAIFWKGVNTDHREIQAAAETIRTYLAAGNTIRITSDIGTDITMRIERRPVHVSTGAITPENIRAGGAACQTWLPAGEVYLAPIPGTAEGTIVVDRHFFSGQEIRDLRMTFKNGKMTSITAKSGLEPLKKLYDASGTGKDQFAAIDIGVNPNVRIPPNSRMVAWMASGMISVGIGWNTWAGGENTCEFALYPHLPNSTLIVDGRTLIKNGILQP